VKLEQYSLSAAAYITEEQRTLAVRDYFDLLNQAHQLEAQIQVVVSDPNTAVGSEQENELRDELVGLRTQLEAQQPFVESVIQDQISQILRDRGVGTVGLPFPPVAFKFAQLPVTLIVSPREVIRQDANIPLVTTLTLEERVALEDSVSSDLNVSTYVTNIGGIGTYPTMVLESSSLVWVFETVVHEWVHNYLLLRPLGWFQNSNANLRTMNETTASLVGGALGREVVLRYYPELAPLPVQNNVDPSPSEPPTFDFRAEMHETRVTADDLLLQGKIEEAEQYMELRRQFFWDHGYRIRILNQAYFAFHGAYADQPQSASGDDPVGKAVREYWETLDSPIDFLRQIALMNEFSDLTKALDRALTTP
jgi:hypothetical protein